MKKNKKRSYPEQKMQIKIADFLKDLMVAQNYREFMCWHCPNGGHRSKSAGALFKAMGVMPGVADLIFLFKGGKSVYVELKAGKLAQGDTQETFEARITKLGYKYYLLAADSPAEGVTKIEKFLNEHGVKT